MRLQSDKNFPDSKIGNTERIQIPQADRGKTDAQNILACVVEITPDNLFKLGLIMVY